MDHPSAPSIPQKQSQLNQSTRGLWNLYASHRQQLERLLVPQAPGGRVCVLGAGNCNDLDLGWFVQVYREVHLVDIDGGAVTRGVRFQKVDTSPRIHIHGSIDLTGVADRMGTWGDGKATADAPPRHMPTAAEVTACARAAGESAAPLAAALGGPFDLVLSPCVLSQLITPIRDSLGEEHPGFVPLLSAIRVRHVELMTALLAPGGRGVLACDLFSSATVPGLERVPPAELPDLMRKRIAAGRYFSGLDPASIFDVIARGGIVEPVKGANANPLVAEIKAMPPWLWHLGLAKTYLVYAMTFTRTANMVSCQEVAMKQGLITQTDRFSKDV